MKQQGIPGLQFVVIHHHQIVLSENLGLANVEFAAPTTPTTRFSVNSIAKIFAATAVMQLVATKRIALHEPIGTYLDSLPADWRATTLTQLLSHTSGLPDMEDSLTGEPIGHQGAGYAWQLVKTLPRQFAQGERFSYNATNYVLIQKLLEKYTRLPFEQVIRNQLGSIGLHRPFYGNSFDVRKQKAPTYVYYQPNKSSGTYRKGRQLRQVYEEFPRMMRADAGLFSSAEDLARWLIALRTGKLLSPSLIQTMYRPVLLNNGSKGGFGGLLNAYGLGWPVAARAKRPAVGSIGGGRAALLVYPKEDLALVLLTNLSGCSPELLLDHIAHYYYPN